MPPNKLKSGQRVISELNQLGLFSPLLHIERAIEREDELLTPYERKRVGELLREARDKIRYANEVLGPIQDKRKRKDAR